MLRLDDRAGSRDLYSPLIATGAKVELTRLPYGDIEFDGLGPDDCPMLIGIEHKKVDDVLKCMQDGRFAGHQLPGLTARFHRTWLVVEGGTRPGPRGELQVDRGRGNWFSAEFGRRTIQYADLDMWLTGIEVCGGCNIRRTEDQIRSAWFIVSLYQWWQKRWQDHRAHRGFDVSDTTGMAQLVRPGIIRRVAKELPGVGWERSGAIESTFTSVVDMVAATEQEWEGIDGIGRTMARRIMKELGSDKLWSDACHTKTPIK